MRRIHLFCAFLNSLEDLMEIPADEFVTKYIRNASPTQKAKIILDMKIQVYSACVLYRVMLERDPKVTKYSPCEELSKLHLCEHDSGPYYIETSLANTNRRYRAYFFVVPNFNQIHIFFFKMCQY